MTRIENAGSSLCPISYDPRLVEETVLLAERALGPVERRLFRRERDTLYGPAVDPDERESRFRDFHHQWFVRLELGDEVRELLDEQPILALRPSPISRCAILRAPAAKDEGADLHEDRGAGKVVSAARPALVIKLRPGTLLDAGRLGALLRRELLQVTDMLDPEFGYSLAIPEVEGGATCEKTARDRYCIIWNASVAGRLAARGLLPAGAEEARRREFVAAFPALGPRAAGQFERIFRGPRPAHAEIWAMACAPGNSDLCPLCRFPHPSPQTAVAGLSADVIAAIRGEFPHWSPAAGLCLQCADLYASRGMASIV